MDVTVVIEPLISAGFFSLFSWKAYTLQNKKKLKLISFSKLYFVFHFYLPVMKVAEGDT